MTSYRIVHVSRPCPHSQAVLALWAFGGQVPPQWVLLHQRLVPARMKGCVSEYFQKVSHFLESKQRKISKNPNGSPFETTFPVASCDPFLDRDPLATKVTRLLVVILAWW